MSIIAKSWKPFGALLKAPFKGAKWAMSSDRSGWVKWPARGAAAAAVLGTGAAVVSGRSRGTETPPELLQAQQMQMENQEILNNIQMQQAMMQPQMQQMPPQMMAQQATNQPDFQVSSMVPEGQLAMNEQAISQG